MLALREELGGAWQDTTVLVMTEFGRTARPNGTNGTDHGTAGAGFVVGPLVSRSAVVTNWPGLSTRSLYESRDLRPTLDTLVAGVFDLTGPQTERVFPGSEDVMGIMDLMG